MSDSHDDSLSRRLSSLETDLAGISLSGPAAARRRAAQRTRHQVTGGVLAGVAAVAAGVFAISPPDFVASPEPVGPVTDSPTTGQTPPTTPPSTPPVEPTPDPTGSETPDPGDGTSSVIVPAEALMLPEDFRSDAWSTVTTPNDPMFCVPTSPASDARASARADFTGREFDTATQFIEVAPVGTAEQRLDQLRTEAQDCLEAASDDDTRLVYVWSADGAGDETWVMSYITPTTLQEESVELVTLGLSRRDDVVSMVAESVMTTEFYGIGDWESAVGAVGRICTVMFGESCTDDPEVERLYPEPAGDVDGWLTIDDLAEAGLTAATEGSEVMDGGDAGVTSYGFVGLERDPFADGAESLEQRTYSDPLELGGGVIVNQLRATFPDDGTARAHYDALVAAAATPTQPGDVIENTGTISGDGYDGTTWQLTNTEYGTSWLYGAAVSGNVVTVVYYGLLDDELSPEQMRGLVERAAQRIGG